MRRRKTLPALGLGALVGGCSLVVAGADLGPGDAPAPAPTSSSPSPSGDAGAAASGDAAAGCDGADFCMSFDEPGLDLTAGWTRYAAPEAFGLVPSSISPPSQLRFALPRDAAAGDADVHSYLERALFPRDGGVLRGVHCDATLTLESGAADAAPRFLLTFLAGTWAAVLAAEGSGALRLSETNFRPEYYASHPTPLFVPRDVPRRVGLRVFQTVGDECATVAEIRVDGVRQFSECVNAPPALTPFSVRLGVAYYHAPGGVWATRWDDLACAVEP